MAGYENPQWQNGGAPALSAQNMNALGYAAELSEHPYGVCSTAAATAAKVVTIDYSGTLTLFAGLTIRVKFSNANSAANPTLNVNNTGAVAIMSRGTQAAASGAWEAGSVVILTYDGTYWQISGSSQSSPFYAGTTAPSDTSKFWIDTANGLKYWDGNAWVMVPVGYST
jgi:hypothetical protein